MHQDYIMRMIQQLSGFLVRVLRLREEGDTAGALSELQDAYGRLAGLPASLVYALSEDDLIALLRSQGRLDPERCFALAELLREEGHVYEDLGEQAESHRRYVKALRLYLEALEELDELPAPLDVTGLEDVVERIGDEDLSASTRRRVVQYLVNTGRFDRAENVVLWSLESPDLDGAKRREAVAFYESLLRKPDDELVAGGLPRDEVEAGLSRVRSPRALPVASNADASG